MNKKIIIFVLAFMITSQAFAWVPLLVGAARTLSPAVLKTTGGEKMVEAVLAIGAGIIGLKYLMTTPNGGSASGEINSTNAPLVPSAIEQAAGFTEGFPSVAPAAVIPATFKAYAQWASTFHDAPTYQQAIAAAVDADNVFLTALPSTLRYSIQLPCTDANYTCPVLNVRDNLLGSRSASPICPTGTYISGLNCVVTKPNDVPRPTDGHCPIIRIGNTYQASPFDPDCASPNAAPSFTPDGTMTIQDNTGRKIINSPGVLPGERIITEIFPTVDAAGKPVTKISQKIIQDNPDPSLPSTLKGQAEKTIEGQGTPAPALPPDALPAQPAPVPQSVTDSATAAAIADLAAATRAQTDADNAREEARKQKEDADMQPYDPGEFIPKLDIPFSITPVIFASSAICPSDIGFSMLGRSYTISYQPMCDLMGTLRPLFLAFGAMSAMFIFIGGLKT